MVLRLYISRSSQRPQVRKHQREVLKIMQAEGIEFEKTDINELDNEYHRSYLLDHAQETEQDLLDMCPQLFDDDLYLGDYEDFMAAVESESLMEFLNVDDSESAMETVQQATIHPPSGAIKLYVSSISANPKVKKTQSRALTILDNRGVEFETIDITAHDMEEQRRFMFDTAKSRISGNRPLTPQFYNDDHYLGDYEDFEAAAEQDRLEEFLHLVHPETVFAKSYVNKVRMLVAARTLNVTIRKQQTMARLWLRNNNIAFEEVDVSSPANRDKKVFMETHCAFDARESLHPRPPQFFNGETYCGSFQQFDQAIETGTLEQFLKLA